MTFLATLYGALTTPDVCPSITDRFYPVRLPDGHAAWPAATMLRIDAPRMYSHSGDSDTVTVSVQINVYDEDYDSAMAAGKEVIDALSATATPWGSCLLVLDRDAPREEDTQLYARQLEFEFIWKET